MSFYKLKRTIFSVYDLPDWKIELHLRSNVTITLNGCWEWNLGCLGKGYGEVYFCGKKYLAHRVSYWFFKNKRKGSIKNKWKIRHTCDNNSCIRPKHLKRGTTQQNARDCVRRNRHNKAYLTVEAVRTARKHFENGVSKRTLVKEYGNAISLALLGFTWKRMSR